MLADDPAAFANAVVGLIQEDERRQRMAQAARRLVVERYDWSAVAQDFEDALARRRVFQATGGQSRVTAALRNT